MPEPIRPGIKKAVTPNIGITAFYIKSQLLHLHHLRQSGIQNKYLVINHHIVRVLLGPVLVADRVTGEVRDVVLYYTIPHMYVLKQPFMGYIPCLSLIHI